jgi:hypothetical protein
LTVSNKGGVSILKDGHFSVRGVGDNVWIAPPKVFCISAQTFYKFRAEITRISIRDALQISTLPTPCERDRKIGLSSLKSPLFAFKRHLSLQDTIEEFCASQGRLQTYALISAYFILYKF